MRKTNNPVSRHPADGAAADTSQYCRRNLHRPGFNCALLVGMNTRKGTAISKELDGLCSKNFGNRIVYRCELVKAWAAKSAS